MKKYHKRIIRFLLVLIGVFMFTPNAFSVPLISNGGFETGDLTNWNTTSNVIVEGKWWGVSPTEGNYQAVMSPFGFLDSDLWQQPYINPELYTEVTISFDYNLKALDWTKWRERGNDYLAVTFNDTEILRVYLNDVFGQGATELGWTTFSDTYPVSVLSGPLTFKFHLENWGEGDEFQKMVGYIDNVSIEGTPIPEPSTLLLLGSFLSGLVGMAGVRRNFSRR